MATTSPRLSTRLRMAFLAFLCRPFVVGVEPYHYHGRLPGRFPCDNEGLADCSGPAIRCMSPTTAEMTVQQEDHFHACSRCSDAVDGKFTRDN
ncbi:hypothetical protein LCGC14_2634270 [marine sediment metagenome]|uniref:Uncharacterized protein n=1 Tax=marine sediment metagenome TaxID=412755 RepID=A0A0F8ZZ81_9ZZZZ